VPAGDTLAGALHPAKHGVWSVAVGAAAGQHARDHELAPCVVASEAHPPVPDTQVQLIAP